MIQKTILDLMKEAAQKAAVVVKENFYIDNESDEKKSHKDIVTKTDKLSQKIIHEHIFSGMKELGFDESEIGFIEEESSDDLVKKHTFIIDPIDKDNSLLIFVLPPLSTKANFFPTSIPCSFTLFSLKRFSRVWNILSLT